MSTYDESSIQVLEGTEGIRQRPSMYIGSTSSGGLHHLVFEVVDNSVDEAMAKRCTRVDLEIFEDNSIKVSDDGVGIPAGLHPQYGISTLEVILTKLHSGGKFDDKAYSVSGGLHGIGLAAVCALSETFHVESHRDGKIYSQKYEKGKLINAETIEVTGEQQSGTTIHFKPDTSIFTVTEFKFKILAGRLKELAYLTEKFTITLKDHRETVTIDEEIDGKEKRETDVEYYFEGGIKKYVTDLIGSKEQIMEDSPMFYVMDETDGVVVEVAFGYTAGYQEISKGFVNNINTHEGGTHLSGFKRAITWSVNNFALDYDLLRKDSKKSKKSKQTKSPRKVKRDKTEREKDEKLLGGDLREGIVAIISVKVPDPQFEGQTKTKLGNSEVDGIVNSVLKGPMEKFLENHMDFGIKVVNKAKQARKARDAARKAREAVRKGGKPSLPGKLFGSSTKDANERELFLVEGQSAGGTAVQGRDSRFQEILFLRGKVLNVEKARLDRAMENAEIRNIITAIGMGYLDDINIEKCRYGKVILLTDADVDGAHIATLLLTFFYRYMKPLIESGRLYIARPPLYEVEFKGDVKKLFPKPYEYLTYDKDLKIFLESFDAMEIPRSRIGIKRFKGLGEMNFSQLEETTMHIDSRRIEQINIVDAVDSEEWLTRLMGDEVEYRKNFIEDDVFEETDLISRGPFYDNAFNITEEEEEDSEVLQDSEREIMKEDIEASLDAYVPEQEILAALDEYLSGTKPIGENKDD